MTEPPSGEHERTGGFALARFESRILPKLAAALPPRVMPDHLTFLGLLASTGVGAAYLLSNRDLAWLWAASAFLVVQWYGDSLDGTLARYRKIERPRYGFYLDHLTDAYSTLVIGLGLGFSPVMLLSVGLAIAIAYLLLSVNVYLETHVFGTFTLGHGTIGPTETRLILIGLNTLAATLGPLPFALFGVPFTVFDVFGLLAVVTMLGMLFARAGRNLRTLAELEPPGVRKE
ncbi:MAG: CDP-alcohol phosphatidyltransferase family protein [Gemmatimonadota bacterium]